jgi:hypothetical protein
MGRLTSGTYRWLSSDSEPSEKPVRFGFGFESSVDLPAEADVVSLSVEILCALHAKLLTMKD